MINRFMLLAKIFIYLMKKLIESELATMFMKFKETIARLIKQRENV